MAKYYLNLIQTINPHSKKLKKPKARKTHKKNLHQGTRKSNCLNLVIINLKTQKEKKNDILGKEELRWEQLTSPQKQCKLQEKT